jgi:3-hydroxyacyl-[acyl-carrier-protein] dehydratase
MKLLGDFFEVLETSLREAGFSTTIELNPSHIVYAGHFPGHPVTPGVVQLQIIHELLENHFGKKLKLLAMPQCKFLNILNPNETARLIIHIDFDEKEEGIKINARGENGTDVYFKLRAYYEI